jgi:glycosyltransferase involved in cell wall biosynthesis
MEIISTKVLLCERNIPKFTPMNKRLRIAYLSAADPSDKRAWSGIHYTIFHKLQEQVGDVTALGPYAPTALMNRGKAFSLLSRKVLGKRFSHLHSIALSKNYANYFQKKLLEEKYDLIFAVAASSELAFLETELPVFYTADATFANMIDYYPYYSNLMQKSIRDGNRIQELALKKCKHVFFPSAWAAQSAEKDYHISAEKISILPFGPNIKSVPVLNEANFKETKTVFNLLFLGVEWERKGGPIAYETLQLLRERGLYVKLTIIGCTPNIQHEAVEIIPFLNKNIPADSEKLNQKLRETDFLILPTRAECFGLVFCEAAAFGIPSLSFNTGGVSGAVKENENGFLFPLESKANDFADKIYSLIQNPIELQSLKIRSRNSYERELNWDAWAHVVTKQIHTHC